MHIEVDQSGKIEDYIDTVIAFRNKEQYTVLLKRKLKNEILSKYRKKHKDIYYRLFAICVFYCPKKSLYDFWDTKNSMRIFLCLKDYLDKVKFIVIDKEYEGREIDIKKHLLRFIWNCYSDFDKKLIKFHRIGKKSNAHRLAYQTFSGKLAPNKIITKKEVEKLL
jgi:hypothetical protein